MKKPMDAFSCGGVDCKEHDLDPRRKKDGHGGKLLTIYRGVIPVIGKLKEENEERWEIREEPSFSLQVGSVGTQG